MATRIHRITMFKIPDPQNQAKLLEAYKVMAKDQAKVGSLPPPPPLLSPPCSSPRFEKILFFLLLMIIYPFLF